MCVALPRLSHFRFSRVCVRVVTRLPRLTVFAIVGWLGPVVSQDVGPRRGSPLTMTPWCASVLGESMSFPLRVADRKPRAWLLIGVCMYVYTVGLLMGRTLAVGVALIGGR